MAYVLNLVMRALEKWYFPKSTNKLVKATKRIVCIFLSLFLIFLIAFLIFRRVIPELVDTISIMWHWIPIGFDWNEIGKNLFKYFTSGVGGIVGSTISLVGTIGMGVTNFVIGLIFAIYILVNKETLARQLGKVAAAYCKPALLGRIKSVLKVADETFSSFIIGQCTEAVILGSLCILGMFIFRFPYAPMVGTFVGATALIPVVGAYLGAAVGFIMILTVSPIKAVLFIVFIVALQQLEGNLIYPKVVGSSIGLPGMWVLAAVTVGGGISGIGGMLIGVPLTATVYKLIRRDVNKRVPDPAKGGKENE